MTIASIFRKTCTLLLSIFLFVTVSKVAVSQVHAATTIPDNGTCAVPALSCIADNPSGVKGCSTGKQMCEYLTGEHGFARTNSCLCPVGFTTSGNFCLVDYSSPYGTRNCDLGNQGGNHDAGMKCSADASCTSGTGPTLPIPGQPTVAPSTPPGATPTPPSSSSCGSAWCTTSADCSSHPGSTQSPGTGYCNPTSLVRCCLPPSNPPPTNNSGGAACGGKCNVDSDCAKPAGLGVTAVCRGGICENAACAAGKTIPGANCTCGANARLCGQTCNGSVGLCAAGQGSCRYVNNSPAGNCPWGGLTYCAGTLNGYQQITCKQGDAPGGKYLVTPTGKTSGITQAEIQQSCQQCGDGIVQPPEECDDAGKNGMPGDNCNSSCKQICKGIDDAFTAATLDATKWVVEPTAVGITKSIVISAGRLNMLLRAPKVDTTFGVDFTQASKGDVTAEVDLLSMGVSPAKDDGVVGLVVSSTSGAEAHIFRHMGITGKNILEADARTSASSPWMGVQSIPYSSTGAIRFQLKRTGKTIVASYKVGTGAFQVLGVFNNVTGDDLTIKLVGVSTNGHPQINTYLDNFSRTGGCGVTVPPTPSPSATPAPLVCYGASCSLVTTGTPHVGDQYVCQMTQPPASAIAGGTVRYEGTCTVSANDAAHTKTTVTLEPTATTPFAFKPINLRAGTYACSFRYCVTPKLGGAEVCIPWGLGATN